MNRQDTSALVKEVRERWRGEDRQIGRVYALKLSRGGLLFTHQKRINNGKLEVLHLATLSRGSLLPGSPVCLLINNFKITAQNEVIDLGSRRANSEDIDQLRGIMGPL